MEDLSALGLRHVGYGIPTELFGPFVSAAIEARIWIGAGLGGSEASPRDGLSDSINSWIMGF